MAKMLDKTAGHGWSGSRNVTYQFPDEWFNGQIWLLERPADFDEPYERFSQKLRRHAQKSFGRKVRCLSVDEQTLKIQAYA